MRLLGLWAQISHHRLSKYFFQIHAESRMSAAGWAQRFSPELLAVMANRPLAEQVAEAREMGDRMQMRHSKVVGGVKTFTHPLKFQVSETFLHIFGT